MPNIVHYHSTDADPLYALVFDESGSVLSPGGFGPFDLGGYAGYAVALSNLDGVGNPTRLYAAGLPVPSANTGGELLVVVLAGAGFESPYDPSDPVVATYRTPHEGGHLAPAAYLQDNAVTAAKVAPAAITSSECPALANLDAAVSTRSTFAGGAVASVTGSVGSVATGGITEASIALPAEAAGRPTGFLAMARRLFEWRENKRTRSRTTGVVALRNAGDTADLATQTQSTTGAVDAFTKAQ